VFVLLHRHAWQQPWPDPLEEVQLKYRARGHGISALLAVVSLGLVFAIPQYRRSPE
jgi:hypothetical protein